VLLAGDARESVTCDVDALGRLVLQSNERDARLAWIASADWLVADEVQGAPRSVLHALRAAVPRLPVGGRDGLEWIEDLPPRFHRGRVGNLLADAVSPFVPLSGLRVRYRLRRDGARIVIGGESQRRGPGGGPVVRTGAVLVCGEGAASVAVDVGGRAIAWRGAGNAPDARPDA
jgi:hypothetical protein